MSDANTSDARTEQERAEMLAINERQRAFYSNENNKERCSAASSAWFRLRGAMGRLRKSLGITPAVYELQRKWLGDLTGKRVLDLGCYSGNDISFYMAERCGFYLGADLSDIGLAKLRTKLDQRGLQQAQTQTLDFLEPEFPYEPFDVVYALSVLHHFKHMEAVLQLLHARLKPGGRVLCYDPLQTSTANRIARIAYRPFQSDADWEFPFTRETFQQIERYFEITDIQGVMGRAKWAIPLAYIPGMGRTAERLGKKWHQRDLETARSCGPDLWRCMQVTMHLKRRDAILD